MDKRELTAAELLEHLYRGLDIEADITAEMDAQDLRKLVEDAELQEKEHAAASSPMAPAVAAGVAAAVATGAAAAAVVENAAAAAEARRAKARLALGFTVVLTGAIVAAATYENPLRNESVPSFLKVAFLSEDAADKSQTFASAESQVVLFVNPFDETEVFEFPAGTSEREARDVVAGLLLKRAMDRKALPN
jgi:hypothetical protein